MRERVEKVDLENVGCDHHCPNCGEWCNCDIMDEETGADNIYYCACDCRIFEIKEVKDGVETAEKLIEIANRQGEENNA